MKEKIKMSAPEKDNGKVEIIGLDNIMFEMVSMENQLGQWDRFAEHVVLSCAMPEVPRVTLHNDFMDDTLMPQALDMLDNVLVRYRKMTAWFRANKIDINDIVGDNDDKVKS